MGVAAIAVPQRRDREAGFPWPAFLPLALVPLFGTSPTAMDRIILVMEGILLVLAMRRPLWAMGALVLSELTINNYMYQFGDFQVSARLVISLLSIMLVAPHVARSGGLGPRAMSMLLAVVAFIAITSLANAVTANMGYVFQFFRYIATGFIAVALLPLVIRNREDVRDLALLALAVIAASAVVAILQHYHYKGMPVYQVVPNHVVPDGFFDWGGRSLGLTENPVYLTNHLMLGLLGLLAVLIVVPLSAGRRRVLVVIALALAAALYLTYTRSWVYSAGLALLAMILVYRGPHRRDLLLVLLVAGSLVWYYSDYQGNRYTLGPADESSAATRPVLWSAGLNIALDNPLLGVGHNRFLELAPEYAVTVDEGLLERFGAGSALGRYTPHNDYLNVWLSFGTAALLLYIAIIAMTFKNLAEVFLRTDDPLLGALALGALGGLVALAVNSLFHNFFDSTLALWILAGLSLAFAKLVLAPTGAMARHH